MRIRASQASVIETMSGKIPGVDIADAAMFRAVFRMVESLLYWVGILVNNAGYSYSLLGKLVLVVG